MTPRPRPATCTVIVSASPAERALLRERGTASRASASARCRACRRRPGGAPRRAARARCPCCRRRAAGGRRRRRARAGAWSPSVRLAISEKSVVPPPTSTTRIMRSPPSARFPAPLVRREPGVEGGLRLLEQRELARPACARRRDGELARDLVERRRHGEHDVLRGERLVGMRRVPHGAQVREVARRRGDRREARDVVAGAPGQDGARCGRRRRGESQDFAEVTSRPGHARALDARELADDLAPVLGPRQGQRARRHVVGAREIERRRQASAARRRAAPRSRAAGSRTSRCARRRARRVDARQRRVGGAEIDADDVSRVRPRHPRSRRLRGSAWRTPNSSFQRRLPSRATHQSSSVPTSVTWTRRRTGTRVPSWPRPLEAW